VIHTCRCAEERGEPREQLRLAGITGRVLGHFSLLYPGESEANPVGQGDRRAYVSGFLGGV
jgi:hypothetical protein